MYHCHICDAHTASIVICHSHSAHTDPDTLPLLDALPIWAGDAGRISILHRDGLDATGVVGARIRGRPGAQNRVAAATHGVGHIRVTRSEERRVGRDCSYRGGMGPGIGWAVERHAGWAGNAGRIGVL